MPTENASLGYGFLCIITAIVGVVLAFRGVLSEPKSTVMFLLGAGTFCMAFILRVIQKFY
jgi:energy-converting hydrogenase Eha subunit C